MVSEETLQAGHAGRGPMAWAGAAIVAAVLLASLVTRAAAELPFTPCVFYNLTGLPCPGCGMTRGFVAMGHGQLAAAWGYNPLAPLAFACGCAYLVWFAAGWPRAGGALRRWWNRLGPTVYAVVLCAVGASWALSLHRHLHGAGWGPPALVQWLAGWVQR